VLKVIDNAKLNITINNNNSIAFRHQTHETSIQIDMPNNFDPSKIDFAGDANSTCLVDRKTKQTKNTGFGNRVEYSCQLTIPNTITEETDEFDYPIQMIYDNIILMPYPKKVKAWRDNYYEIFMNDSKKVYDKKNGTISFPYTINIERLASEGISPFQLEVTPDSMEADIQTDAISQGICTVPVSSLEDGENYIFIELTEKGCPPLSFPFTITYTAKKQPTKANFKISKTTQEFDE